MYAPNIAKPAISAVMFVEQDGAVGEHAHVDHRLVRSELEHDPRRADDDGETEQAEHRGRGPAPPLSLGEPEQERRSIVEKSTAPGTSMRDGERTGDSGTKRRTRTIATATAAAPTTKIHRQLALSTITPESTRPSPPPTPKTAESSPMPTFTRSGGNSSRMIPKLSGNTAPPAPETTRAAISVQMSGASAQPTQPTKNVASERRVGAPCRTGRRACRGSGVSTAAESRLPSTPT